MNIHLIAGVAALLAGAAQAQQQPVPPGTPPEGTAPPPTRTDPPMPGQTQGDMPGMPPAAGTVPATPPTTSPDPQAPTPRTMGQQPTATPAPPAPPADPRGTTGEGQVAAPRQAMTDYPVCTRALRDNCRQPDGRRVPPPG